MGEIYLKKLHLYTYLERNVLSQVKWSNVSKWLLVQFLRLKALLSSRTFSVRPSIFIFPIFFGRSEAQVCVQKSVSTPASASIGDQDEEGEKSDRVSHS